jgi:peptide/nickel transport system substrate-binding protein
MNRRLIALVAAAALAVAGALAGAGCGGPAGGGRLAAPQRGAQALNPQPASALRDRGDLRIPLDVLPVNYNYNQVDGHEDDTHMVLSALMPRAFKDTPDGEVTLDADYVSSAELVSAAPQVVHYHINDRAVWSNGRPITWQDFASHASANSGANPAYQISDRTGYQDISRVERGATDKDVLVHFDKTYAEWPGLFYGLYPMETNVDPAVFNTGWVSAPLITAGPFRVGGIDQTAKTITLVRNERWWGERPRLDRLIFVVTDRNALADRLANNELDLYEIGSSVDLYRRALTIPGVQIRQAIPKQYAHLTFNGAPGAILSELALRRAVAQGVDPLGVARRMLGPIVPNPVPMGNHIYPIGSKGYRDNSDVLRYDPAAANRALDELGWSRPAAGAVRVKDGHPLALRFVSTAGNPIAEAIAKTVQDQLARIGVRVVIVSVPFTQFFRDYINVGNFDLTSFQWVNNSVPFSSAVGLYQRPIAGNVGGNFGRIHNTEISELFARGLAELDEAKRIEIGNQVDRLVWAEVHHIPLYPQSGAFAVRDTVANFGAKGLGDWDFVHAGLMR